MAKGQKRGNREAKKPKTAKAVVAASPSLFQQKPTPPSSSKNRGK